MTKSKARNSKFVWQDAFAASGLKGNTAFIGLVMSLKDNGDGRNFFVSYKTLSETTGLSERTVQEHVRKLTAEGWIKVLRRGGNQGGVARATTYALTFPEAGQQEEPRSEPEGACAQPAVSPHLVDPHPLDPPVLDPSILVPGQEVSGAWMRRLSLADQGAFMPAFDGEDRWTYEPALQTPLDVTQKVTPTRPTSEDWKQRHALERVLHEEGLDPLGEPLRRKQPHRRRRG